MSGLQTGHQDVARTSDEMFLEIVLSDEQLLQAEFDAIIAAEWPKLRSRTATSGWRQPQGSRRPGGAPPVPAQTRTQPSRPESERRFRGRSPPSENHPLGYDAIHYNHDN